jgi:hypothetical protein
VKNRTRQVIGVGAAAAALLGLGYVGVTWLRYGKQTSRNGRRDPLLDRFMPTYEVQERHETKVAAPAEVTYAVARELNLRRSALVRAEQDFLTPRWLDLPHGNQSRHDRPGVPRAIPPILVSPLPRHPADPVRDPEADQARSRAPLQSRASLMTMQAIVAANLLGAVATSD